MSCTSYYAYVTVDHGLMCQRHCDVLNPFFIVEFDNNVAMNFLLRQGGSGRTLELDIKISNPSGVDVEFVDSLFVLQSGGRTEVELDVFRNGVGPYENRLRPGRVISEDFYGILIENFERDLPETAVLKLPIVKVGGGIYKYRTVELNRIVIRRFVTIQ